MSELRLLYIIWSEGHSTGMNPERMEILYNADAGRKPKNGLGSWICGGMELCIANGPNGPNGRMLLAQ